MQIAQALRASSAASPQRQGDGLAGAQSSSSGRISSKKDGGAKKDAPRMHADDGDDDSELRKWERLVCSGKRGILI